MSDTDIAVFKHPQRDCVYLEGKSVNQVSFDHSNLVDDQLDFYRDMDYPKNNNGLYELPARVQRNTELTQRMGWMWVNRYACSLLETKLVFHLFVISWESNLVFFLDKQTWPR